MQTDLSTTTQTAAGFDQLAVGLRTALDDFEKDQTPEKFAALVSSFKPVSEFGLKMWRSGSTYTRRHPLHIALGAAAVGFIATRIYNYRRYTPRFSNLKE